MVPSMIRNHGHQQIDKQRITKRFVWMVPIHQKSVRQQDKLLSGGTYCSKDWKRSSNKVHMEGSNSLKKCKKKKKEVHILHGSCLSRVCQNSNENSSKEVHMDCPP